MDLLTEFRRELMKATSQIEPDAFLTKAEVEGVIRNAYGSAKSRCQDDEDVLAPDVE